MKVSKKMFNLFTISEARNVLFGIATLWIGLFHSDELRMSYYTGNRLINLIFRSVKGTGNIGVDMFLFLSGIGLFFSFTKDSRVLSFWKKRLMRVLPTAFVIATLYFSFRYVNGKYQSGIGEYFSRETFTFFFWKGERVFWFISLILVLYLMFPVFYKIIERFRLKGMLGLVAFWVIFTFTLRLLAPVEYSYIEIALCRIPSFIIGIWAGKFVMEKKEISRNWLWAFLAAVIASMTFLHYYNDFVKLFVPDYNKSMETMYIWMYRYVGTVMGISLVVLGSFVCIALRNRGKCNLLRNFFEFVGMYSMEYYMIYLNIAHYLNRIYNVDQRHQVMLYFGCFILSLVLCVAVRKVCDFFMDYMQRKPKDLEEKKNRKKLKAKN